MQLKVKLREGAMVPDYNAQEAGHNRFLGRAPQHPWAPTSAEVLVEARPEYLRHLKLGELIAIDEATAKHAGVSLEENV